MLTPVLAAADQFVVNGWSLTLATPKDALDAVHAAHRQPGALTERAQQ